MFWGARQHVAMGESLYVKNFKLRYEAFGWYPWEMSPVFYTLKLARIVWGTWSDRLGKTENAAPSFGSVYFHIELYSSEANSAGQCHTVKVITRVVSLKSLLTKRKENIAAHQLARSENGCPLSSAGSFTSNQHWSNTKFIQSLSFCFYFGVQS